MAAIEAALRSMEDNASNSVEMMLGPNTIGNLIISVLIVGLLAGFSEELFFRGALQRLLSSRLSTSAAIWTAAVIFSAMHFQFFGFVPRMLLGAYLGYLLVWSGSIWLPAAVHAFNNIMFIVLRYTTGNGDVDFGSGSISWIMFVVGTTATAVGLAWLYKTRVKYN
jgi:membrane protease YdiL (CAAX protease family)